MNDIIENVDQIRIVLLERMEESLDRGTTYMYTHIPVYTPLFPSAHTAWVDWCGQIGSDSGFWDSSGQEGEQCGESNHIIEYACPGFVCFVHRASLINSWPMS